MNRTQELELVENQFLIRFPEDFANQLNLYLDSKTEKEPQLAIQPYVQREGDIEKVYLKVELDGVTKKASILQLPTITETFKTVDHVNFFKSNDISEMIYVHEDNESDVKLEIAKRAFEVKKSTVEVKKVMRLRANSGITPPTQYIRQRYFRRRPVMPQEELKVVEQELQKIRQDIIAIPRSADEPEDKKKLKRKYNKKFQ